jgi:signal transduction histidine kinase
VAVTQVLHLLMGASFALSGAVVAKVRPGNAVGPLMFAFGLAQFLNQGLLEYQHPATNAAAILIGDGATVLYVLVLLAFPDGRLHSRRDWLILGPVLLAVGPLEVAWLMCLEAPAGVGGNALLVWPNAAAASAIDLVQRLLIAAAELALAAVLVRRWLRASPPLRRALLAVPVGALALCVFSFVVLYERFEGPAPAWLLWTITTAFVAVPVALLASTLRARLDRTALGGLLIDLRSTPPPAELNTALGRALGDPSLELAYWLPEFGTYVDVAGRRLELPEEDDGRAITLLETADGPLAALVHDPSLRAEPARLAEVAAAAGMALENTRLQAELRARLDELRGSRARAIEAADDERRRLERDLHDGAQKRLVTLSLSLGLLESRLNGDVEVRRLLDEAREEVAGSLRDLRDVAHGLHPAVLTGHGLGVALESLAAGAPVPVSLDVRLPERLRQPAEVAAYYLVCEALTNMAKHAHASAATVAIGMDDGSVVVEVSDDGVGGADTRNGTGLRGLADRVEALDGSLQVWSPLGIGTRVRGQIPCA